MPTRIGISFLHVWATREVGQSPTPRVTFNFHSRPNFRVWIPASPSRRNARRQHGSSSCDLHAMWPFAGATDQEGPSSGGLGVPLFLLEE